MSGLKSTHKPVHLSSLSLNEVEALYRGGFVPYDDLVAHIRVHNATAVVKVVWFDDAIRVARPYMVHKDDWGL